MAQLREDGAGTRRGLRRRFPRTFGAVSGAWAAVRAARLRLFGKRRRPLKQGAGPLPPLLCPATPAACSPLWRRRKNKEKEA